MKKTFLLLIASFILVSCGGGGGGGDASSTSTSHLRFLSEDFSEKTIWWVNTSTSTPPLSFAKATFGKFAPTGSGVDVYDPDQTITYVDGYWQINSEGRLEVMPGKMETEYDPTTGILKVYPQGKPTIFTLTNDNETEKIFTVTRVSPDKTVDEGLMFYDQVSGFAQAQDYIRTH